MIDFLLKLWFIKIVLRKGGGAQVRGNFGPITTPLSTGKKGRRTYTAPPPVIKEFRGVRSIRYRRGDAQVVEFEIPDGASIGPQQRTEINAHLERISQILTGNKR